MSSTPNSTLAVNTTSENGVAPLTLKPSPSHSTGNVSEHRQCRVCCGALESVVDLGLIAPSDFVQPGVQSERYPLDLCLCQTCGLAQLRHTLNLDESFRQYWYRSGLNQTMVKALADVVDCALRHVSLNDGDVALDIGCNDGTLLSMLPRGVLRVGFEPALNLADSARLHCDHFINDFFQSGKYPDALPLAKLITSIAMFYDLDDPRSFVEDIDAVLHPEGVWVVQMMDFESMLVQRAFDNICFEHLIYYTLADLRNLIKPVGLEVFHVSHNRTNGGSLRAMIGYKGQRPVSPFAGVTMLTADKRQHLACFEASVDQARERTKCFISDQVASGKTVYGMGASTKGNTLLQYFGLDSSLIKRAAEVNRDKWGLQTVATNIPIESERSCIEDNPDYFLVLPWHFIGDFVRRNQDYLNRGGKFIVPLPQPRVIDREGVTYL